MRLVYSLVFVICVIGALAQAEKKQLLLKKIETEKNPDSLYALYNNLGILYYGEAQFTEAQTYFFKALKIGEASNNHAKVYGTCNNIACVYNEMWNGKEAVHFAERALKEGKLVADTAMIANAYLTLGNSYYRLSDYPNAIRNFEISAELVKYTKDSLKLGTVYNNIGAACFDAGYRQKGLMYYKKGLAYQLKREDKEDVFASYVVIASAYNDLKQYDSSAVYLNYARPMLNEVNSATYLVRDYNYSSYKYNKNTGHLQEAMRDLEAWSDLKDSILNSENLESLSNIKNQYIIEKKESEIAAQKEVLAREKNIRLLLTLVFVLVIAVLVFVVFWLRNRQKTRLARLELQKQQELQNRLIEGQEAERQRIARELHDGIVQELTAINLRIKSNASLKAEELADKIGKAANEVRAISHQMMPLTLKQLGLVKALEDLFHQTYVPVNIGYEFEHFSDAVALPETIATSIYRICQELVANSLKHSKATLIHILLKQLPGYILLVFEDNGKGFDMNIANSGLGMVNITSRVKYLNGEVTFDSGTESGTVAHIKIPLA